ncbi:MAG: helix-turn-helix transcriptional regulator [Planctomycetota bacterium]
MARKTPKPPISAQEANARHRRGRAKVDAAEESLLYEAREVAEALRLSRGVLADLRAERERQGLSLADLMNKTGMSRAAISKLENDEGPNPTIQTIVRLASALGLDVNLRLKRRRA